MGPHGVLGRLPAKSSIVNMVSEVDSTVPWGAAGDSSLQGRAQGVSSVFCTENTVGYHNCATWGAAGDRSLQGGCKEPLQATLLGQELSLAGKDLVGNYPSFLKKYRIHTTCIPCSCFCTQHNYSTHKILHALVTPELKPAHCHCP